MLFTNLHSFVNNINSSKIIYSNFFAVFLCASAPLRLKEMLRRSHHSAKIFPLLFPKCLRGKKQSRKRFTQQTLNFDLTLLTFLIVFQLQHLLLIIDHRIVF